MPKNTNNNVKNIKHSKKLKKSKKVSRKVSKKEVSRKETIRNDKKEITKKNIHFDKINYLVNDIITSSKKYNKQDLKIKLSEKLNFSLDKYNIYFLNNLYETYFAIISNVIKSFLLVCQKPHIISTKIEHPYILDILNDYKAKDIIDLTYIPSNIYGAIDSDINSYIIPNKTCLIVVSFSNYLTGSINDLKKIGSIAHNHKIPIFSDLIFSVGKVVFNPDIFNIDCFSITFQKNNLNLLIINKNLVEGYNLVQNDSRFQDKLQNFIHIDEKDLSKSVEILNYIFHDFKMKIEKILENRTYFIKSLHDEVLKKSNNDLYFYEDFIKKNINTNTPPKNHDIIIIGHKDIKKTLPNILSFIIITELEEKKIIDGLKKKGIIVLKNNNSDLFESLGITTKWTKKIISICFDETHTKSDINKLVKDIYGLIKL